MDSNVRLHDFDVQGPLDSGEFVPAVWRRSHGQPPAPVSLRVVVCANEADRSAQQHTFREVAAALSALQAQLADGTLADGDRLLPLLALGRERDVGSSIKALGHSPGCLVAVPRLSGWRTLASVPLMRVETLACAPN